MPRWTSQALVDLQEVWTHIAFDNEIAADRLTELIFEAANRLDRFPRLGRPMPTKGVRQFFVPRTKFKLLYKLLTKDRVEIVRIHHTSREWPPQIP